MNQGRRTDKLCGTGVLHSASFGHDNVVSPHMLDPRHGQYIVTQMKRKIVPLIEYASESTMACLVMMAQGNFLALTISHLVIASQTGIVAGVVTTVTLAVARTQTRWIISAVLGVTTAIADFLVHPGSFETVGLEALLTGLGAAVISYLVATAVQFVRAR